MNRNKVYIKPDLIIGHIDLDKLDLSDLPEYPSTEEPKRYIGVITRVRSNETFINIKLYKYDFIKDKLEINHNPIYLYADKKNLNKSILPKLGDCITLNISKKIKQKRNIAVEIRKLENTFEDYIISQNYINASIDENPQSDVTKFIDIVKKEISKCFFNNLEDRKKTLEYIYKSNNSSICEWELIFNNITDEEKDTLEIKEEEIGMSLELRFLMCHHLKSIKFISNPNVISAILSDDEFNKIIKLIKNYLNDDNDKIKWIEYITYNVEYWESILVKIFTSENDLSFYKYIINKELIIHNINNDIYKIRSYIKFCVNNSFIEELLNLLNKFSYDIMVKTISIMPIEECLDFIYKIPLDYATKFISNKNLEHIKSNLIESREGREIVLKDIYNRRSNSIEEWEEYLSNLDEQELQDFQINTDYIDPSPELCIHIYKYTLRIDFLIKDSVLFFFITNQESIKNSIQIIENNGDSDIFLSFIANNDITTDEFRLEIFSLIQSIDIYNSIKNKVLVIEYLNNISNSEIKEFIDFHIENIYDIQELNFIINGISSEKIIDIIKDMSIDESVRFIQILEEDKAISLLSSEQLKDEEIFDIYIGEKWDAIKSNMLYCAFDLESDGEVIKEFAFIYKDNTKYYESEEQIKSLLRNLKRAPIIVGHNIIKWDLNILEKKGLFEKSDNHFIWDTLKIEVLLNPCRYAYSLYTEHNAKFDTELTNDLFWNQLYRLATDPNLLEQIKDFLPNNINELTDNLKKTHFKYYFEKTFDFNKQYFNELKPLSNELLDKLNEISKISSNEKTLIIAPTNLWARLAIHIPINFPYDKQNYSFRSINTDKLKNNPFDDKYKQIFLERFCNISRTPIIENIPQYLLINDNDNSKTVFANEELKEYLYHYTSHIDCIDISFFNNTDIINKSKEYKHIYIIGTDLEDRIHKSKIGEDKSFSELVSIGSIIPFTMANTNYTTVPKDEIEKLGIEIPEYTANIWVEREEYGKFGFYMNYEYQTYRQQFLSNFLVEPKFIKWEFVGDYHSEINITQVSSKNDISIDRLNNYTTERNKYWLFQMALLNKIHQENNKLPIIYVVNDDKEISVLSEYARSQGFYIPELGSGFRKLEYINNGINRDGNNIGMLIISKNEFINIISYYRTNIPFCFVWDNLDIDRYKIMWDKLPFEDDLVEEISDEKDDQKYHTTARQCIHAVWPIYEHYYSLVMANNENSKFYIIDPYFDDYEDIAKSCQASTFKVELWNSIESFQKDLEEASKYFFNNIKAEENISSDIALELIRQKFINEHNWKQIQKEVLPLIWEKENDYLISMPTGEGKSVCFQGPAIFRAAMTNKLSLVITPLKALMKDQVEELNKKGFVTNVDYLSGDRLKPEVENIYRRMRSGEISLLYITPERFRVKSFMDNLYHRMNADKGMEYIIFDEAHCISQWGLEFRPDYRNSILTCLKLRKEYNFKLALFSATVTTQVEMDIRSFLPDIKRIGQSSKDYNPIRNHISISTVYSDNNTVSRIENILDIIKESNINFDISSVIIFCRKRNQCEELSDYLQNIAKEDKDDNPLKSCIDKIGFYHAKMNDEDRKLIYSRFKRQKNFKPLYILCCTKAFGMGMDIPNIHYVIHFSPPSILEDYLQEVGRAGRNEEVYKQAFNNGEKKIPAICLVSKDDFSKLRRLLIKGEISWSNLQDFKNYLVNYIKQFKDISESKISPTIVPFNLWTKDEELFDDTTASRMLFHWLEHIGSIKLGFLSPSYISITINDNISNNYNLSLLGNPVYLYVKNLKIQFGKDIPLQINEIRKSLRISIDNIINELLLCMKHGLLKINNTMKCKLVARRSEESKYMILQNKNIYALHIAFEGIRIILSRCKKGKFTKFDHNDREEVYKSILELTDYNDIKTISSSEGEIKYMPWKREGENLKNDVVVKFDTFKKNIYNSVGPMLFTILNYIKDVKCKIMGIDNEIVHEIKVLDDDWEQYIDDLEKDCLKLIEIIINNKDLNYNIYWADLFINELNWMDKGYSYFDDVLSILYALSYIQSTPRINNGIEVYTTDSTLDEITENTNENDPLYLYRKEFDEVMNLKKISISAMQLFSSIKKEDQGDFIQQYFQCRNYKDYISLIESYAEEESELLNIIRETAIKEEEDKLKDNNDQYNVYNEDISKNINVLAGPGAGKTHVLTLRCARLIYKEHIDPKQILVLAYNRAVVVELRNRLNTLFIKLGMSRIANSLNVYTFHGLAKKCMGKKLELISTDMWEKEFYNYINNDKQGFKTNNFADIKYILVDEFQDITQIRLDFLIIIKEIYPNAKFFTIGDINQSIYGFDRVPKDNYGRKQKLYPDEYAKVLSPKPYYDKLKEILEPEEHSMFTNYRSFQKILDKASDFISEGKMPISAKSIMEYEPNEKYVYEYDNRINKERVWFKDILDLIEWAKNQNIEADNIQNNNLYKRLKRIDTIAVFFRTNNEVYRGYSRIKNSIPKDVRIRIQGESIGELWREREVFYLINVLKKHKNQKIDLENNETSNRIKAFLSKKMDESPSWDSYTLDITYTLVLNYIDSISTDNETHTFGDLADYIIDIAGRDDASQIYKIYENYSKVRILQDKPLTIILTTMHKVKGLEFDVVVTTPSFANLPLVPHNVYEEDYILKEDDLADIEEEKRLMFVAYTRAKKRLIIYKSDREIALENNQIYKAPDLKQLRYTEPKPGLEKYYLSYNLQINIYSKVNNYISENIKKDDPIEVKIGDHWGNYYIYHNNFEIGKLSSKSNIANVAQKDQIYHLKGFFVSNILTWTYQDTLIFDQTNNTNYAKNWSDEAKKIGFVNIVQISGFGTPVNIND